jgi:tetratricopeptide (TPR) repeat protein
MNTNEVKRGFLLPQCLPLEKSFGSKEAVIFGFNPAFKLTREASKHLLESIEVYKESNSPFIAAEIMGTSYALGNTEISSEMATIVLKENALGSTVKSTAKRILGITEGNLIVSSTGSEIRKTKEWLKSHIHDGLIWLERARLYSLLGQYEKSLKCISVATGLYPRSRIIVRSAIRLLAHTGKLDEAIALAKRVYQQTGDPLILGPLLSMSLQIGGALPSRKKILNITEASRDPFQYSEVLAVIAQAEMESGNSKVANELFNISWGSPTTPTVSHGQWVIGGSSIRQSVATKLDISKSNEALAWHNYDSNDISKALEYAGDWALEEAYSKRPFIFISGTMCTLGRFNDAEKIARVGLTANPSNKVLRNNLIFSLLRQGNVREAEKYIPELTNSLSDPSEVASRATYGLFLMLNGNRELGLKSYDLAIETSKKLKNDDVEVKARINKAISTLQINEQLTEMEMNILGSQLKKLKDGRSLPLVRQLIEKLESSRIKVNIVFSEKIKNAFKYFPSTVNNLALKSDLNFERNKPIATNRLN